MKDMNMTGWLDAARADIGYGWRQLRLNPGFASIAILSLTLGIGANTAIFQLIDALRLRGLPVKDPWQLAAIDAEPHFLTDGWYDSRNRAFTWAQVEQMMTRQQAFSGLLVFGNTAFNLSEGGRARFADALYVSANFLDVLGVKPLAGRGFGREEASLACASPGVLLNYAFWQREYGGDLQAIGRTVRLDGHKLPIVGITPPEFFGVEPGHRFDIALPLCADNLFAKDGKGHAYSKIAWWLTPLGRLKPGWTVERASQHFRNISPAIFRESLPTEYRANEVKRYLNNKLRVVPANAGVSSLRRQYESPLFVLMGITGLVLLIACANLANLLLARASAREREIAVRQALGASRGRLLLQLIAESFLLALAGALLGALLAQMLSRLLVLFITSADNQLVLPVGLDWRVFAFTSVLAVLTCLLFGLFPAVRASSAEPASAMRGSRTSTATRERNGLRRVLVVAQVSLSLVLLVGALLFSRSLQRLFAASVGFNSQGILVTTVVAPDAEFKAEARPALFRETLERVRALPGISAAATVLYSPMSGDGWNGNAHADSDNSVSGGKEAWFNRTGPGYFSTMGTPLLAGRDFDRNDNLKSPRVAVVNKAFAHRFFANGNPVGRTFRVEEQAGKADALYNIVGLVADTKYNDLREQDQAIAFFPMDQNEKAPDSLTIVVRSRGALDNLSAAIAHQVAGVNRSLLVDFKVLDVQIRESLLRDRLMANLSIAFGILAALLSTLGLYGVMSYLVARRRAEIGLRLALGAGRTHIFGLVMKDAALMLGIGLAVGLGCAVFLSRYAESLLYQLKGTDPLTLVAAAGLLAITAAGATLLPARRAATLEPMAALREE